MDVSADVRYAGTSWAYRIEGESPIEKRPRVDLGMEGGNTV